MAESDLRNFLKANPPARQFTPYCRLNREADTLTVYVEGDADYSEPLCDGVTIYRSLETDEVVGCRIEGILGLLEGKTDGGTN